MARKSGTVPPKKPRIKPAADPARPLQATVFGGTGFIGRLVVHALARAGYRIKVPTRFPERAFFLRPSGFVGQIVPVACDFEDPQSIEAAISGSCVVVNAIGILAERRKGDFQRVHVDIPAKIAQACAGITRDSGWPVVDRLIHISALACELGTSRYARTKYAGEQAVLSAFPLATILRPGVVFGEGDSFFNRFGELARVLPCLPLIGGGKTRFQPVYVGDVVRAVMAAATVPPRGAQNPQGRIFSLAGSRVWDFREIYQALFRYTGRVRPLVSIPWPLAALQGACLGMLPNPLLTRDQVESLRTDCVQHAGDSGLADLGITPTDPELILPCYLDRFIVGGAHGALRRKAREDEQGATPADKTGDKTSPMDDTDETLCLRGA